MAEPERALSEVKGDEEGQNIPLKPHRPPRVGELSLLGNVTGRVVTFGLHILLGRGLWAIYFGDERERRETSAVFILWRGDGEGIVNIYR